MVEAWLGQLGLGKHAAKIVELTEAEDVTDFALLDSTATETLISQAGLRLVSAEKFRRAVASLRPNEAVSAGTTPVAAAKPNEAPAADSGTPPATTDTAEQQILQLEEAIAICLDRSGSMGCPLKEVTVERWRVEKAVQERTRMSAPRRSTSCPPTQNLSAVPPPDTDVVLSTDAERLQSSQPSIRYNMGTYRRLKIEPRYGLDLPERMFPWCVGLTETSVGPMGQSTLIRRVELIE